MDNPEAPLVPVAALIRKAIEMELGYSWPGTSSVDVIGPMPAFLERKCRHGDIADGVTAVGAGPGGGGRLTCNGSLMAGLRCLFLG